MSITTKLSTLSVLALLIAAPAAAETPNWSQTGDFYAPTATVVQQPTAQELKQAQEGDFYAPTKVKQVSGQRTAAIENCTQQANAEYGPSGDVSWRRFNHDAYAACMTDAGQTP